MTATTLTAGIDLVNITPAIGIDGYVLQIEPPVEVDMGLYVTALALAGHAISSCRRLFLDWAASGHT